MTVDELKRSLEGKDGRLHVFFSQTNDEFKYSLLETVKIEEISFSIETLTGGVETAKEECLILTDE